jgi:hypothetical protein
MKVPSMAQLKASAAAFDLDWGGVDDVLYEICADSPGHTDRRTVTAKIALIGRAYSAGLERCVTPPPGVQSITVIAAYAADHGADIDAAIDAILAIDEPLASGDVETIVRAHGDLLKVLSGVTTKGKTPRSFAAKYLHFHNPVVPIYDEYARITLSRLVRWDGSSLPFPKPPGADPDYYDFCVRFWRIYEACWKQGVAATVKALDQYLWAVPQ